ncbi:MULTISPECIES: helix-turn-helix domain-containing protein [Kordiimonas]|uniref:helix-turn-helix domain-containing protein n=1 Tax=Kordiimonas TaxID=288021 RepID=UPI001FF5FCDA|nr:MULTISPECIES: helix-turn-helix domain-containing protein [Kordiimonas]MCK0068230.1 helix-turn-helix domain-containing protein [Kordiimonas laminariae]UTW59802.1 helix-turn-helix domain-containing protein [Kordiimonas sp. SCSIO 12603]
MSVQKYRLEKAWSQEELAFHAGVSVRTIQRIESGKTASLETLKCLAAVLETNVSDLMTQERTMSEKTETRPENTTENHPSFSSLKASREAEAIEHVKNLKGFYTHLLVFVLVMPGLILLNLLLTPVFHWWIFVLVPWLFAIALQGAITCNFFKFLGPEWEEREFRKRMNRD